MRIDNKIKSLTPPFIHLLFINEFNHSKTFKNRREYPINIY